MYSYEYNSNAAYVVVMITFLMLGGYLLISPNTRTDERASIRAVDSNSLNALLENGEFVQITERDRFMVQQGKTVKYCKYKSLLFNQYKFDLC
jgi:hypothetical protein